MSQEDSKWTEWFPDALRRQFMLECYAIAPEILSYFYELDDEDIKLLIDTAMAKAGVEKDGYSDDRVKNRFVEVFVATAENLAYRAKNLRSSVPANSLITNSNVANAIQRLPQEVENLVPVIKRGRIVAETKITINILDDKNIRLSNDSVTEYDKMVHDAVCTLYASGNRTMTADMIYRAMNGFVETEKVSQKAIHSIEVSIRKMDNTRIYIDSTQQLRAAGLLRKKNRKAVMSERMLNLRELTVTAGGCIKRAWRVLSVPIVYSYSVLEDQVISVPRQLLNTKDIMRSSESIMMIRYNLLRWIETMKRFPEDTDHSITFDELYHILGDPEERQARAAIRANTFKLLDNYIRMHYISGYRLNKNGAIIRGVIIDLAEEPWEHNESDASLSAPVTAETPLLEEGPDRGENRGKTTDMKEPVDPGKEGSEHQGKAEMTPGKKGPSKNTASVESSKRSNRGRTSARKLSTSD